MRVGGIVCRRTFLATRLYRSNEQKTRLIRFHSTDSGSDEKLGNSYVPKKLSSIDITQLAQRCASQYSLSLQVVHIPAATKRSNAITKSDINQSHTLYGWLLKPHRKLSRDLEFFKLRDFQGNVLQLKSSIEISSEVISETPVAVTGIVRQRPQNQRREGLAEYELEVTSISPLNSVRFTLPFRPEEAHEVNTATRAKYRYLDLRNKAHGAYLRLRDEIVASCRNFLRNQGFVEIETPLLFKPTPEGAREFIVPTRKLGEVYALPQSPQQYKQILIASGIERYFQVAKCFRDEDLRADRQPEFTQVLPFE